MLVKQDNKKLKQDYMQRPVALGVFLIRNTTNDTVFLASGKNLPGIINRHRFQLEHDGHPNKSLQADWNELGPNNFAFEVLEELVPPNDPSFDLKRELLFMEDMWLDKLKPFGERGYNQPKLTMQEKLRRIANSRQ